jgi:hypothetical protein
MTDEKVCSLSGKPWISAYSEEISANYSDIISTLMACMISVMLRMYNLILL